MRTILYSALFLFASIVQSQTPALVGYWHNWNDGSAPYIQLDQIDSRYNVVEVSFAVPINGTDYQMGFTPDGVSQATLISQIQTLKSQGKKVIISMGGATAPIQLNSINERDVFVSTMTNIINTYGFDGVDIDFEGSSITVSSGTNIANPTDVHIIHLINAIKQLMVNFRSARQNSKMMLTMAPETAFVQGGMSAYGGIWGAYLPVIHALRDSLDILQVQLYNSGSMYGINGSIYTQGSADFIISQTEAVIRGFNTNGGFFTGIPAEKVCVGLPACPSAAGGGYTAPVTVQSAMAYIRGTGARPGSYTLVQSGGYPNLRGMMTWSINWDRVSTCGATYEFAQNFQTIFNATPPTCGTPATPTVTNITSSGATLTWSAVSGATSYVVRYKLSTATTYTNVTVTNTTTNLTGLTAASTYVTGVQAVCANGSSAFGSNASFTTSNATTCGTPATPTVTNITSSGATLTWTAVSGATSYVVRYKLSTATTYTNVTVTNTTTNLTGLTAASAYVAGVQAVCANGSGAFGMSASFTTSAATCQTPTNLVSSNITLTSATISWGNTSQQFISFQLQYRRSTVNSWTTVTTTALTHNLTNLLSGTTYQYRIRRRCGNSSYSAYSSILTFTTLSNSGGGSTLTNNEVCNATSLTVGNACIQVASSNNGATQSTTPAFSNLCASGSSGLDVWYKFNAPASGNFNVQTFAGTLTDAVMTLYYANGCQQLSAHQCVDDVNGNTMPNIVGVGYIPGSEMYVRIWGKNNTRGTFGICVREGGASLRLAQSEESLAVYPNPANDLLNIEWDASTIVGEIILTDILGREVRREQAAGFAHQMAVGDLESGMYFVSLMSENQRIVTKKVVVRNKL